MTVHRCNKCRKKFVSEYLLNKHLNRAVPCDKKLSCDKCSKEFSLKKDYDQHMNRKTSCVVVNINNQTSIEISLQIEQEKTRRELEKIKLKAELAKETKLALLEKESELRQREIELRKEKNLEIEEAKEKRKEKTVHIINNEQNITIQNNFILNIQNKYVTHTVIALESKEFKEYEKDIYEIAICKKLPFNKYLFDDSENINEFISTFLRLLLNNACKIDYKNMFYSRDLKTFFGIFKILIEGNDEECYKEIREITYEQYIDPILRPIIQKLFDCIKDSHRKEPISGDKNHMKYIDITNNRNKVLESLSEISKDILYDGNMITEEEYKKIKEEFKKFKELNY